MLTALLTLSLSQLPTPFDFLDNTEIGDANQYVGLRSKGVYEGHGLDKVKGETTTRGTWAIDNDTVTVKVATCKGPACKEQKKDYTVKVTVEAPRAMTLVSTAPAPLFPSGSYYCHYLGCEQRHGTEILSKGANLKTLHAVEDHLIQRNHGRNSTVVWIGERPAMDTKKNRIETCGREPERAKAALETLKGDLEDAKSWLGEYEVDPTPKTDCSWDVRFFVRDDVQPPVKKRGG
jgi:hypothetical protein